MLYSSSMSCQSRKKFSKKYCKYKILILSFYISLIILNIYRLSENDKEVREKSLNINDCKNEYINTPYLNMNILLLLI